MRRELVLYSCWLKGMRIRSRKVSLLPATGFRWRRAKRTRCLGCQRLLNDGGWHEGEAIMVASPCRGSHATAVNGGRRRGHAAQEAAALEPHGCSGGRRRLVGRLTVPVRLRS